MLSVLTLLLSLFICRFLSGRLSVQFCIFSLGTSSMILLLTPVRGGADKIIPFLDVALSLSCILSAVFEKILSSAGVPLSLLYSVLLALPLPVYMISNVRHMTKDMNYLCGKIPGWEVTVNYAGLSLAVVYEFAALLLLNAAGDAPGDVTDVVAISVSSVLYLAFFVRHLAGGGDNLARDMKARTRERIRMTLEPAPADDISINYRMLYARMKEYMETKRPYLSSVFCLDDMAKALYTNGGYVSRMINSCTGGNFSRYVNNYRVRYAMELFKKDPGLKVSELGQLSGFSTKVTFNMAFKLIAGQTPGEWCRHWQESTLQEKGLSRSGVREL